LLDLIDDSRCLEGFRRAVMDLRSIRDEAQDDPFCVGRVCCPEHGNAVRFEGGRGPRHPTVPRQGSKLTLDGWVEIELEFGGHVLPPRSGALRAPSVCLHLQIPYD